MGATQDTQGSDALSLAAGLAEALGADLIVAHVVPNAFDFPAMGHVDAEWRAYLADEGRATLEWARSELAERVAVRYQLAHHMSSGLGLNVVAEKFGADVIVIGSASAAEEGRIEIGSTADQLLHGSAAAVALAPFGYSQWAPARVRRPVVAYQDSPQARHALELTLDALEGSPASAGAAIALVAVVSRIVRFRGRGSQAEEGVLAALADQARLELASAEDLVHERLPSAGEIDCRVLAGRDVSTALARFEWADDDLLVVGSANRGSVRRVLLGDTAHKLIRAATVPVCAVPRVVRD